MSTAHWNKDGSWWYSPGDGQEIEIGRAFSGNCILEVACDGRRVSVAIPADEAAARAASIAQAICETAGRPKPVILERPEVDLERADGVEGFRVLESDGAIHVGYGNQGTGRITPGGARRLAAIIAAYADAAEAKPDPAEVKALKDVLLTAGSGIVSTRAEHLARAVLRAGYRREAAS